MLKIVQINTANVSTLDEQLHKLTNVNNTSCHLKINTILKQEELAQFKNFIEYQQPLPFSKLSFQVDLNTLRDSNFLASLEQLNNTAATSIELIFMEQEVQQFSTEINEVLTQAVAPKVAYSLQIRELGMQGIVPSKMVLTDFQNTIIANIQQRNNQQIDSFIANVTVKTDRSALDINDPLAKKIKLKELIRKKTVSKESINQYIPLEIQHVETVEQEVMLQELVELQYNLELHEIQQYEGQLIGFREFSSPFYKNKVKENLGNDKLCDDLYSLLQQELFANLPHAIKYISPEAAEQLALYLPNLVTLNKDNLPNGFYLKQTSLGEFVLDYDEFLENERANPYTPVITEIETQPIYDIELNKKELKSWINDNQLFAILCPPAQHYSTPRQLINLWIKHGDEGVKLFFNQLQTAVAARPQLTYFLLEKYLAHLPQWDHLFNNQQFLSSLTRISHFDEPKLQCFTKFINDTGSSCYDFGKTVAAFEVFWGELQLLCNQQQVSINEINTTDWSTPAGGNPVIYMERLLFMLKNARSLNEQFKLLAGITLNNYTAYYAMRFEGFKTISAEMSLTYDAEEQNQQPFNQNFNLHRIELEELYQNLYETGKVEIYYAYCYRFIGIQEAGITVSSIIEQFKQFKHQFISWWDLTKLLFTSLFFISHERFIENEPLKELFKQLNYSSGDEVLKNSIKLLNTLYKRDIKLNQLEGTMLFSLLAAMNSVEFQQKGLSKEESINKLLDQLTFNKFGTLKLFNLRLKTGVLKWPLLFALDTAEFLARDSMIAAVYHDDLLLFSDLINSTDEEAYHAKLEKLADKNVIAKTKLENLTNVKNYLHKAATDKQPSNLHYAIQVIINAKKDFTYKNFLAACAEIETLPAFDSKNVDEILHKYNFKPGAALPAIFSKDNADLKAVMISLIIQLKNNHDQQSAEYEKLALLSITELHQELKVLWQKSGILFSIVNKIHLAKILNITKDITISSAFSLPNAHPWLKLIAEKINQLPEFQDYSDFEKLDNLSAQANNIAALTKQILQNPFVIEQEQQLIAIFEKINFTKLNYEILYGMLYMLSNMPQRNYLPLLNIIFANEEFFSEKEKIEELLNRLSFLNTNHLPTPYLETFSKLAVANHSEIDLRHLAIQMIVVFAQDNNDPILKLVMSHPELNSKQIAAILPISNQIHDNRDKLSNLLTNLIQTHQIDLVLEKLNAQEIDSQNKILRILSKSNSLNRITTINNTPVSYKELVGLLIQLPVNQLNLLAAFYETTPVSADCLFNALKNFDLSNNNDWQRFSNEFEKAPFGERDFQQQFSCAEVERVINQLTNLMNGSIYTYQYRKQLMEAFLLVNEMGQNLPVYNNKAAKDLTNEEIKTYFANLKDKNIAGLTPLQNRLLALALMREAMYRSTGEFPYSTQMITLIDSIMHSGDFISNVDTGQGKSLVDTMKTALLWLDSDRVDFPTSSLVDAKRDIANYGPFLQLLNIPYSTTPISSTSAVEKFQQNGINFSTSAQLSLFLDKAKVTGVKLDNADTRVSLVINESDYAILDDRVIYRFATTENAGLLAGHEWIYYAINEFVLRPEFIANNETTALEDTHDLKIYLRAKAREQKKSDKIIDKFSHSDYLTWLESALIANYILKENEHYVIPPESETTIIRGAELESKVVKVLMKDKKVSQDSTFGNGIQQLLYASLNTKNGSNDFIIEPQNKTIISSNNKNLIDYYRTKNGYIWGSSATVGSQAEIQELHHKYGFDFGKTEPHQINKVRFNEPITAANEQAQFSLLINQLTAENRALTNAPSLVFCKDINTAIRLFNTFKQENSKSLPVQLYTGVGKEEDFISQAATPGMITITTSALGRNTDVLYDKAIGMCVWHTFVDSFRRTNQKSGRTGRQGSAGEVNFIFNALELGGRSIQDIRHEIDSQAAIERSINEELYNILGYLLRVVDKLPNEKFAEGKTVFLKKSWAAFSAETEVQYRECRHEETYNIDQFVQKTLFSFNQILSEAAAPVEQVTFDALKKALEQKFAAKPAYKPYQKEVKLEDCIPAVDIAYQLFQFSVEEKSETIKDNIKNELTHLFEQITNDTFIAKNSKYLHYLAAHPAKCELIVEAHQEFLTEFLQANLQKPNFSQRWLGYAGKLNQIANNQHYLLQFYAFTSLTNHPAVEVEVIKQTVSFLLDEYIDGSWFINANRKQWAADLKNQISASKNSDEIIECLADMQVEVAKQDIATNKSRLLKPLHFFGHSRYQTTLTKALNLASSLSAKKPANLTEELKSLLTEVTDNLPITELTTDELKHKAAAKQADKGNASVIIEILENELTLHNVFPAGTVGRKI